MADNQWYILMGQERQGPLSTHDIRFLISRKKIDGGTLIWSEGLGAWSRLREVEEFHPKHKDEPEPDPEQSEKPDPEKTPPPSPEPSAEFRWIQKVIPILLALGLVGAAVYVFVTGEPTEEIEQKTTSPSRKKRQSRTPRGLVEQLKRGDAAAKTRLIQAGSRFVIGKDWPYSPPMNTITTIWSNWSFTINVWRSWCSPNHSAPTRPSNSSRSRHNYPTNSRPPTGATMPIVCTANWKRRAGRPAI